MSRAKIIDYYLEKLRTPGFEFHQIRQELEANNVDEEEIRAIVRVIDNELQRQTITKSENNYSKELIWAGAVVTILGAFITIGTYTGIINSGNSYIIAYGPFLGGLSILFTGLAKRRN